MRIKPCRPYHAVLDSAKLLKMNDGKSFYKLYYFSIIGRDQPERYEWAHCSLDKANFERVFIEKGVEGVGFITAFPHITKVFRFSPLAEIVLDVSAYDTDTLKIRDCGREEGFFEFACYAEAGVADEEYRAWAEATDVQAYMTFLAGEEHYPVKKHDKLLKYWEGVK